MIGMRACLGRIWLFHTRRAIDEKPFIDLYSRTCLCTCRYEAAIEIDRRPAAPSLIE